MSGRWQLPSRGAGGVDAVAPRRGSGEHVPALDGVRGVAVLLVFLYHAYAEQGGRFLTGGFLGVDLFFVLSGFLITMLLLRERDRTQRISLAQFYRRRALRLLPALVVMLAGFAALTTLAYDRTGQQWNARTSLLWPLVLSGLYVSNLAQGWFHHAMPGSISQLWSLGTEEQFYLLWPAALILVVRLGRGATRPLTRVLTALIAAVAATRLGMTLAGVPTLHVYFAPETTFDALFVGCLFGVWYVRGAPRPLRSQRTRSVAALAGCGFIAWSAWYVHTWGDARVYRWVLFAFVVAAGLVIFSVATDRRSPLARVLSVRPLRYVGRISYGLYLWHPLVFWFVATAVPVWPHWLASWLPGWLDPKTAGVVGAVLVAVVSYHVVELPFLRRKERLAAESAAAEPAPALSGAAS